MIEMHFAKFLLATLTVSAVCSEAAAQCPRNDTATAATVLANEADGSRKVDLDLAITKYEAAARLDPSNHRILGKLSLAYMAKEAWEKAATTLDAACKLAPAFAVYFYRRGYVLTKAAVAGADRWAEARAAFERAIALDPNYADAHFDLADVLLRAGDDKGALEHFTKAVERRPDELAFYAPLADLYIRLGFVDLAEQTLKEGLTWDKGDKRSFALRTLYGYAREQKNDVPGAIVQYLEAKKTCEPCAESGQAIAFFNLGAAQATVWPPHKSEAMANLTQFTKVVCRGAAAARYRDQCAQAQQIAAKLGAQIP